MRFAMASEHISAAAVEISEFPDLASKHRVRGVPHTVINGKENLVGAYPDAEVASAVLRAIGK